MLSHNWHAINKGGNNPIFPALYYFCDIIQGRFKQYIIPSSHNVFVGFLFISQKVDITVLCNCYFGYS